MKVLKRDNTLEIYSAKKILKAVEKAYKACGYTKIDKEVIEEIEAFHANGISDVVGIESIQDYVEKVLIDFAPYNVAKAYIIYRAERKRVRDYVKTKQDFIDKYKSSKNTADATIDDNSNVANKNIGILNSEIHKEDNIQVSRAMVTAKLKELFPDFNYKQYVKDLESHIIYKHDESSFAGAIAPYCCSISMYPFLLDGIKKIGGLSAAPKNLDSFCGMYINLIFATSAMFAGAVATSEFLVYFDYFARKEWGNDYYKEYYKVISKDCTRRKTILSQIHQYFQEIIYSINQPAAARGMQSAFVNFSIFDKEFFNSMFESFVFPDGDKPIWESVNWLQKEFMEWFNNERLKTILTFPVVSVALVYKDGKFLDEEMADFVAKQYSKGNSFFTYISDTVDSLSSCCFHKNQKVLWKSSTKGVQLTTFEELHNTKWEPDKKNLRIFHNGSWIAGKSIKLNNRKMYKIVTSNHKEFIMTDNHINVTYDGEKEAKYLTTSDYLMFNTCALQKVPDYNLNLTYEQGFTIGAFLGDGSFGARTKYGIYDINFSQNKEKYEKCIHNVNIANEQLGGKTKCALSSIYNNVYPVRICSKELCEFIKKWTNWNEGTKYFNKELNLDCLLQSYEFRKGILDGWYNTDGGNSNRCYTTSESLKDCMEVLITSLGLNSIIDVSNRTDEKVIIRGQEYNRNYPLWCIRWYEPCNKRQEGDIYKWKNNSQFFKIINIEEYDYPDDVYCIECSSNEEPYFTLPSGLITHNCRLKNVIQTKEFNFTNGNMGIMTGSKSVITLNLNRIVQDWRKSTTAPEDFVDFGEYLQSILNRVYKYHVAYNELLWDMYNSDLLPVYKAGFIHLDKQYLTIGLNGLNQAAEYLGMSCNPSDRRYNLFCKMVFSTIKAFNGEHNTKFNNHQITLNTELVPAESLAIKNYNWDKNDGYWVPEDTNLYASYIFKPNDKHISFLDKLTLHGNDYIGDYLDGGSAAHINFDSHPSYEQCLKILNYAAEIGCSYFTFNIPNSECEDCGYITKVPIKECPKCGSKNISLWDRVIGYLTKIKNWSEGRQIEQKTRVYSNITNKEEK